MQLKERLRQTEKKKTYSRCDAIFQASCNDTGLKDNRIILKLPKILNLWLPRQ